MESRSYVYPKCEKSVKSISGLIRYIYACKIPITLPSCQPSNFKHMLDYNTTNGLDLPSDKNEENISPRASNNGKEGIRPVDIDNNEEDIKQADIDKQRPATPNWTSRDRLLSQSSLTFREMTFSESKFLTGIFILDNTDKYPKSQTNISFYPFNGHLDYALASYFADSETTKHNISKFLTNQLMKSIIKNLS